MTEEINNTSAQAGEENFKRRLSAGTRRKVWWRSQFLQGSWNYERMQNLGWCYSLIPALKKLYGDDKEQMTAALKRHMEFFNTHPYVAAPILGVELSLEEERANGMAVEDETIQGVKIGMMGPLAGVGDPVFWATLRPIIGALAAGLAISGNFLGPVLFFVLWNVIRMGFLYLTQEIGYKQGSTIASDMSGGLLRKVTVGASILGMFIMGVLIPRWTSLDLSKIVLATAQTGTLADTYPAVESFLLTLNNSAGHVLDSATLTTVMEGINKIGAAGSSIVLKDGAYVIMQTTTLQSVFNQLIYGLGPLVLMFLVLFLLRKKVNPIIIILVMFALGILGAFFGIL